MYEVYRVLEQAQRRGLMQWYSEFIGADEENNGVLCVCVMVMVMMMQSRDH